MNIRILQEADAEAYRGLRLTALAVNPEVFGSTYEREAQFSPKTFRERVRPSADRFVLGAFDDACALAGIVSFVREEGIKTAHKGNVYGMFVRQDRRGEGIGRALLQELIRRAKACDGLEQLNLTVVSRNESAKKLYESLGFVRYGVERHALKSNGQYDDEDFMALTW